MHVEFVRTGGFGGIRLSTEVDTSDLPEEQASTLDRLVHESAFFALPEQLSGSSPARDRFQYHVTVSHAEQTHSVTVSDAAAPDTLRPLLNYLTTLAMVRRGG